MKSKKDLEIEYNITFIEACQVLKKSRKTITRYIQKGILKPERIKSQRGTLEYRFSQVDLESLKIPGTDKIRQDIRGDTRQAIRQDNEVINILRDQLNVKDKQINSLGKKIDQLIERSRETNILINGLTNRVLMLEDEKREDRPDKTERDIRQDSGQNIREFFKRLFKGKPKRS